MNDTSKIRTCRECRVRYCYDYKEEHLRKCVARRPHPGAMLTAEVADALRITHRQVRHLITDGKLKAYRSPRVKAGRGHPTYVLLSAVERFILKHPEYAVRTIFQQAAGAA